MICCCVLDIVKGFFLGIPIGAIIAAIVILVIL